MLLENKTLWLEKLFFLKTEKSKQMDLKEFAANGYLSFTIK